MLYGASYEGHARECRNCGEVTNAHRVCESCETTMCECCDFGYGDGHFCSKECRQDACEHISVSYQADYDVDEISGHARYWEVWTCRDCGARIDEDGEIIRRNRRVA
jgi:hypothetical protein